MATDWELACKDSTRCARSVICVQAPSRSLSNSSPVIVLVSFSPPNLALLVNTSSGLSPNQDWQQWQQAATHLEMRWVRDPSGLQALSVCNLEFANGTVSSLGSEYPWEPNAIKLRTPKAWRGEKVCKRSFSSHIRSPELDLSPAAVSHLLQMTSPYQHGLFVHRLTYLFIFPACVGLRLPQQNQKPAVH